MGNREFLYYYAPTGGMKNDESIVIVYPHNKYSPDEIKSLIQNKDYSAKDISFLVQSISIGCK